MTASGAAGVAAPVTCEVLEQPRGASTWRQGLELWRHLSCRAPAAGPFLSVPWISSWLETFSESLRPLQLAVYDANREPFATCLLTPSARRILGVARSRLHLNADGEPSGDSVMVEHNDVLCLPGGEAAATDAIASWIDSRGEQEFLVAGVSEETAARFGGALAHWSREVEWRESPYVDLERLRRSGTSHLEVVSANTRAHLRRALRAYSRRGPLEVELATSPTRAAALFEELITLHRERWRARGSTGAFASSLRTGFHRRLMSTSGEPGVAQLLRVSAGGETIGILYNLHSNRRVAFYQSGFSYKDGSRLHPGLLTHHLAIEYYRQHDFAEYDFLASGPHEGRYKRSLSTNVRQLAWVEFSRPGVHSSCLRALRLIRRAGRTLIERGVGTAPGRA